MKQDVGLFIHPDTSFSSLYDSYRECANLLYDQVLEDQRKSQSNNILGGLLSIKNSSLIYPLFFNYRQSVELLLKKALDLSRLGVPYTHDLRKLYKSLCEEAEKECDERVFNELKNIAELLNFFHESDKRGTGFRYEDENHEKICIIRLRDSFEKIYATLDSVIDNFGAIRDYESENV